MKKSKCSLSDRLNEAMKIRGKRAGELARDLHIPKSAISQYLSGKIISMERNRLISIAEYLAVSEPWLLGYDVPMEGSTLAETGTEDSLNQDLVRLINLYTELSDADKQLVMMLVESFHQKTKMISCK